MDSPFEEYKGKRIRLVITDFGHDLTYTGEITKLTGTHIFFVDKFSKPLVFAISAVKKLELQAVDHR